MTTWTDILTEAIAAADRPGELSVPTALLELNNRLGNPLRAMSAEDTEHEQFAALDRDLEFVWPIRSSSITISEFHKGKLASSVRWLIGILSGWRQGDDPTYATLATTIAVAARLDDNGVLWALMPAAIAQNYELGRTLADILAGFQVKIELTAFSRSPIVDEERIEELSKAEGEKNWPALRFFAENIPFHFHASAAVNQSVGLLNRFFPDLLIEATRAVSQIGIAMQVVTAMSIDDAFDFATRSQSDIVQFAAVCRLVAMHDGVQALNSAQEEALATLLCRVSADAPRWAAWMKAFAAHPYRARQMQPAIGLCLARSDEIALRAYIDAIDLQAGWLGRDEVKACLGAFANRVSLERRQAAWKMAFNRWSDWSFGAQSDHSIYSEITVSNMDFAVVGYASECLTPKEREAYIAGCWHVAERAELMWHRSQREFMNYIYRGLSRLQPFYHSGICGADRDKWLWDKGSGYLVDQLDDPYWRSRYFLHTTSSRR